MDILIIGNGFDLAHGLKTSYKDFLNYCKNLPFGDEFKGNNIWLNWFLFELDRMGDTWIDLETKIYEFIQIIFNYEPLEEPLSLTDNSQFVYFTPLQAALYLGKSTPPRVCGTKEDVANFLYLQLREFTEKFQEYLNNEVIANMDMQSPYLLALQAVGVESKNQEVHVLSFNYTDTCERLYKNKFNTYCSLKIKPVYVHGKVNNGGNCNMVLGTHSFDRMGIDKKLLIDLNVFQKHNQRHRYNTIEAYQELLKTITNPKKIFSPVFHIVGHSLDKTDHKILKHLFQARKNSIIKIYYHNEEAQEKLINNITEIIGEEEVMSKVRLIHQHDEARGILRKVESRVLNIHC